jgi:phosphoribosylformylglycinamidine synthase II
MLKAWRVEVSTTPSHPDPAGARAAEALRGAGLEGVEAVRSARGFLLAAADGSTLPREVVETFARTVLADPIADAFALLPPDETTPATPGRITVVPRAGVTDPVAHSIQKAARDAGLPPCEAGSYHAFVVTPPPADQTALLAAARKALANDVVQDVLTGTPPAGLPDAGGDPDLRVVEVPLRDLDDDALERVSRDGRLALDRTEMQSIRAHYRELGRDPTRIELETIAQTWSEHCKHKTLTGRIRFGDREIDNLLKTRIGGVTRTLDRDFCLSVFVDNAGVIAFDDDDCVCIKVETHNRPSAIEPFGGAGTGVGGVIRDILGTGLGARPVASTDVFCLAPPDLEDADLPRGCLHPKRVLRGVVSGVRDYGNPMGIPTVNGAVHFDEAFVGNPLVYVGNVGMLPRTRVHKQPKPGDAIVALGGRTGRDGIHGATFSSLELDTESEKTSSGAVQIGDPITERVVMDTVLRAAEEDLFSAITDCGAGGFSSAVGEMAEGLGAVVDLARAPLKYRGLAPWEIWVSEAQERMVLSVPQDKVERLLALCDEEGCEAFVLGTFDTSGKLVLNHGDTRHGELDLHFLHDGVPKRVREAVYTAPDVHEPAKRPGSDTQDLGPALLSALSDFNVASKEWIVRQYDHEVQAGSAGKPFVGRHDDGPADAAVIAPKLGSRRGVVLSSGLNPRYSRIDPAAMAECALDEAMRNLVAVGGDPEYTAILDNYCWGRTDDPERLGELVRATDALCDLAIAYRTPFVSGKDSLNNEFFDADRDRRIVIPGCILVTAMGVIPDVRRTLTSDFKKAGSRLVLVGVTKDELGGSVFYKQHGELGANVPRVDKTLGKAVLDGVYRAIQAGCALAAHDLSEGGLGVAVAEMAIGGRLGVEFALDPIHVAGKSLDAATRLFSESASRLLLEVPQDRMEDLHANLRDVPWAEIGEVREHDRLVVTHDGRRLVDVALDDLVHAFKHPLDLDGDLLAAKGGAR